MPAPPLTSPYAPGPNRMNDAFRIADLIRRQGYSEAAGTGRTAMNVAALVGGAGEMVFDSLQRQDDRRKQAHEAEAIADLFASGTADPAEIIRRVGLDRAKQIFPMVESSLARRQAAEDRQQALAEKQRAGQARQTFVAARRADPSVTPEQGAALDYFAGTNAPPPAALLTDPKIAAEAAARAAIEKKAADKAAATRALAAGLADPKADKEALRRAYIDATGEPPSSDLLPHPPAERPPNVGTFEDYVIRRFGPTPTAEQITAARKTYNQSDDRPAINVFATPPAGNFDLTGEAFIKTLPKEWQATVRKVANYDEDPTKVVGARGGARDRLMQWVNQANPTYDASALATIAPTRKAFTSGVQGRQITALNTAIGHIDQLTTAATALDDLGFVPANQVWNTVRTAFGSDAVTNFDTLKEALSGEVAGVLAQNGATVSAITAAKERIKASQTAGQLAGYVRTMIPVLGSKLASLNDSYRRGMSGHFTNDSPLSQASRAILEKHGFDPEHPEVGQAAGAVPDGVKRALEKEPANPPPLTPYVLRDGSKWRKNTDGSVTRVP